METEAHTIEVVSSHRKHAAVWRNAVHPDTGKPTLVMFSSDAHRAFLKLSPGAQARRLNNMARRQNRG